ncbi:unnamed protein product [Caenorhabditis auriculariae]|uniref:C2H2-type domain-containing protein n=1 Tax=Caenorhabditis auriculariae TaxID=2777116 RepID=A0A8S1GX93_9PELO|nr:unnamed protein product [Caenorhabditis auriculariae]
MYVVVNIQAGQPLVDLMTILASRMLTFSVTDDLRKNVHRFKPRPEGKMDLSQGFLVHDVTVNSTRNFDELEASVSVTPSVKIEETSPVTPNAQLQEQIIRSLFSRKTAGLSTGDDHMDSGDDGEEDFEDEIVSTKPKTPADNPSFNKFNMKKRGMCHVCKREVSVISTHKRRHAITHLGFKTLRCTMCHKYFSRQDLCGPHFKKEHPGAAVVPFEDMMSGEDLAQLKEMLNMCFPKIARKPLPTN